MTPTPYLKKFNTEGGTLYVFPSVSRDLTKTLVSNDYEFKFSHFACLNIPDIYSGKFEEGMEKGFYIQTLIKDNYYGEDDTEPNISNSSWTNDVMQKAITENLQNYVMNFETAILNGEGDNDDYDPDILTSVSEKVFWNWMQKVGAIKFNETGTLEDYRTRSDRTVQYLGSIDIMNAVEINGDAFEELYIHVPSNAGASTTVYFRPGEMTDNKNYLNKNYSVTNGSGNPEYIIGRGPEDENIYNSDISIKSIVDIDEGGNIYKGDMGHTIDFRDSSYDGGYGINNMNNKSLDDFEFNAVLIYYDVLEKTGTPNVRRIATNLYGILFLDQVSDLRGSGTTEAGDAQGYFQRYPKKRETVYGNGNSYALKIDLKIDTIGDSNCTFTEIAVPVAVPTGSEEVTVDGDTWGKERIASMILYTKALTQLQNCIDTFYEQKNEIVKLTERVATLENLVMGIDSISVMKEQLQLLTDRCDNNSIVDTAALLSLIDANSKKLENIMTGGKDLKLQFDTDVLQPGTGIGMVKTPNKVVISSEQRYSINTVYDGTSSNDIEIRSNNRIKTADENKICRIPLKPGENFAVIYLDDTGDSNSNLKIVVDDTDYNWEVGQSLKLYFICDDGSLRFTDSLTTGVVINPKITSTLSVPGLEFEGNNLIEVICVALADSSNDDGAINEDKFIYLIK